MADHVRRNGTFADTRAGLTKANRWIVGTLVVSCFMLCLVWFVFVSGYWTVQHIEMNEPRELKRGEVASTTYEILDTAPWKPWDKRNIFFIDTNALALGLREQLFAEQVTVDKIYPNILRLKIIERQRSVVVASKDQLLLVDANGIVTGEVPAAGTKDIRNILGAKTLANAALQPVIICELPELATAGYQAVQPQTVQTWLEAYKTLITSGVKFSYLRLSEPKSLTLRARSDKGYQIIFDLSGPLEAQIETYKKFVQSQGKNPGITEYVDVRIPGKIFVK